MSTMLQSASRKLWALIMSFVTGTVAFAVVPAMQMLMLDAAKGSEMLASAMVQASENLRCLSRRITNCCRF